MSLPRRTRDFSYTTSSDHYHNPNFELSNSANRHRYDLTARDVIFRHQMANPSTDGQVDVSGRSSGREHIRTWRVKPLLANTDDTPLSSTFFSRENCQILQNAIRAEVHKRTGEVIAEQSYRELLIIMRSIFFQKAVHSVGQVKDQVSYLNSIVLGDVIQPVITHMEMQAYYLKNQGRNPIHEALPISTNIKGRTTLEYRPGF